MFISELYVHWLSYDNRKLYFPALTVHYNTPFQSPETCGLQRLFGNAHLRELWTFEPAGKDKVA